MEHDRGGHVHEMNGGSEGVRYRGCEVHRLLAPLGTNRKKVEFFVDSLLRRKYCRDKEFPKYQADGDNSDDDGNHTVTNQAQKLEEDDYDLYFGVYAPVDK